MSYQLSWFVPNRVIELTLPVLANDDDVMQAIDVEINAMLDTASQRISVLIDLRQMKEYPSASSAMKMTYYKHPNTERLIVVGLGSNPILRFLGGLVGRGVGIQIKDFATREEAQAYLTSLERL